MGRKNNNYDKEYSRLQKLQAENKKLKRELKTLRKSIKQNRIDIEEPTEITNKNVEKDVKNYCPDCQEGVLSPIDIPRPDGLFKLDKCNNCDFRTSLKKVTS